MKKLIIVLLVSVVSLPFMAHAEIWAERESLAKIESELAALEALVHAAKAQSNSEDRMTFDYKVLLDDLKNIRSGITHHLTVPMEPVVPSTIDALRSEYTAHQK